MNKIALFILYNHHFTKNIDRIEELYKGKFSYIYHLIPFYNGDRENVISVYESSFQFQSYIAQAYQQVKKENFTHFFVVADDMIINPQINEDNLFVFTGIPEDAAFITDFRHLPNYSDVIPLYIDTKQKGVEVTSILPSIEDAKQRFEKLGIPVLPSKSYARKLFFEALIHRWFGVCRQALHYLKHKDESNIYPVIWGYSDVILIPQVHMDNFVRYCGALAALNVFVENAIPTAICLSCDKIVLGNEIKLKYITQLYTLGQDGQKYFEEKYSFSVAKLLNDYPKDIFYIHPLKLSKWQ